MENHIKNQRDTLDKEMQNLERAFSKQKTQFLRQIDSNFTKNLTAIADKCSDDLDLRLKLVIEQEDEMSEMINNDAANIAEIKMKMEEAVKSIEEEIDMIKAVTHLNNERLDYEIHVLSKHEEENSVIKSEQKRKITSLQDVSNKLKLKLMDTEKDSEKEKTQLLVSIQNIKKQLNEIEVKQRKFGSQSAKTRTEMATMMKSEAYRLLEKIIQNDRVLEYFYLKRPFAQRQGGELENLESMSTKFGHQRHSIISSQQFPGRRLSRRSSKRSSSASERHSKRSADKVKSKEKVNIKELMLILIDKADFLVDATLNEIMEALPNKEKLLIKVDNILNSLHVDKAKDLDRIVDHLAGVGGGEDDQRTGASVNIAVTKRRSEVTPLSLIYLSYLLNSSIQ